MSNQIVISSGAKVRALEGVLTGTAGVVNALGINVPSGIPQLDGSGKILVSQLPNSVMEYKGSWNAATNTPTLVNGTGNAGDVYLCEVAGTVNFGAGPITFAVGDQVIYSGSIWQRASGATGTVTSVAVTESGDALTITGSPITTSGTINIGFAGNSGQYVNGAGGLTTFPSLTGFVPYTGATANVDLGTNGLIAGAISSSGIIVANGLLGALGGLDFQKGNTPSLFTLGDVILYSEATTNNVVFRDNVSKAKLEFNNSTQTYTFPAASGTVALTSDLSGYVPYTGATANVDLGTFNLTADVITGATGSFASSGGSDTFAINHSSGSGIALNITKGGNGEGLYINKTSGSGNAATIIGTLNATTLVKSGGTSSQFLKADGSVDSNTYLTTSAAASTYVPYTGATTNVNLGVYNLTANQVIVGGAGVNNAGTFTTYDGGVATQLIGSTGNLKFFPFWNPSLGARINAENSAGSAYIPLTISASVINLGGPLSGTSATFSGAVTSSLGSGGANFNSNAATTGSVNAYRVSNTTGTASFGIDNSTGGDLITGGLPYATLLQSISNTALQLGTNQTARMTITSGGNVGIGTSSPSTLLHTYLANGASDNRILVQQGSNGYASAISLVANNDDGGRFNYINSSTNGGTTHWQIGGSGTANTMAFLTGGTERMRITSGGVRIFNNEGGGTTNTFNITPYSSGNALANKVSTASGWDHFYFQNPNGNVGSISTNGSNTTYSTSSDYRLKEDLKEFNGLSILSNIKVYDFKWKADKSRMFGVVAHELAEVLNHAVVGEKDAIDEDGAIKAQGVDYSKIVPILVKSIQELEARIKQLENK